MACSLSITSVTGSPSPVTTTIHVTGTLTGDDCQPINTGSGAFDVVVEVDCGGGPVSATTLSSGGNWSVNVPVACSCTKPITVRASCVTNPECTDTFSGSLQCEEPACPTGTISVSVDGCDASGKRLVTLTANILTIPPGSVVAQFDYGDGFLGSGFPIPTPGVYPDPSAPHPYTPPGPPNPARLIFILPSGCSPLTTTIPTLAACPINCPEIVTATATPGACNPDGTRAVHFAVTLSGGPPQTFHWDFGHGPTQTTMPPASPDADHDYPAPGTGPIGYTATFTVTGFSPACVDTVAVPVNFTGCGGGCPTIGDVSATFGDCIDNHTRFVTLDAVVTGGGATEYEWDFGDGSPHGIIDATVNSDPAITHSYEAPGPGPYTATVTMKGPPGCPDQSASHTFSVPVCNGGNGNGGGSGWCGALLPIVGAFIVIATALTVLALAFQVCPLLASIPVPGWVWGVIIGLWVAVAILLVVWALLCGSGICDCPSACDWAAIAWMTALSAALMALYLAPCCTGGLWWLLTTILAASFVGSFIYWRVKCQPSWCQAVDLLLVVFVSIVAVILGYIVLIPAVAACGSQLVATGITTIGGALAIAAAACHN